MSDPKMADGGFSSEEALRLAKLMDVDLQEHKIPLKEWIAGLNEELEHKDVTGAAAVKTGKIALAHLKEDPQYYSKVAEIEKGVLRNVVSKIKTFAAKVTGKKKDESTTAANAYFRHYPPTYTNKKDDDGDGEADRFYHAWKNWHGANTSKALKDLATSAILTLDNTPMLVLSKSEAEKAFNPVALKPGSEETNMSVSKAKMIDTAEEETQKGFPDKDKKKFKANAKDTDSDSIPDGLDKDPKDAGSRKADVKKAKVSKIVGPSDVSSAPPSGGAMSMGKGDKNEKDDPAEEDLEKRLHRKGVGSRALDPSHHGKAVKKSREEAIDILRKACASLDSSKMDLKKDEDEEEETEKAKVSKIVGPSDVSSTGGTMSMSKSGVDINKALRAIAVAGMSRRARMDAAFQLGRAVGKTQPAIRTETARIDVNIGVDRVRPTHEPPVVPVRRVEAPRAADQAHAQQASCTVHGYIHKSDSPCPLCEQAEITVAGPFWRR